MNNWFDMISLILPALISIICKPDWSNQAKYFAAFCVSLIAALSQVLYETIVNENCMPCWENLPTFIPKVVGRTFILVMGSYAIFWRPLGLAKKIEEKVNG